MAKTVQINVRIEADLKHKTERVFKGLPFDVSIPNAEFVKPSRVCCREERNRVKHPTPKGRGLVNTSPARPAPVARVDYVHGRVQEHTSRCASQS